jgi:hypothetical protein
MDIRWVEPAAMALVAAAFQPEVKVAERPQRRGTYSHGEGTVPELPQLYAQEIALEPAKPLRRDASLNARPRLAEDEVVVPAGVDTGAGVDVLTGPRVVGTTTGGVVAGTTTASLVVVVGTGAGVELLGGSWTKTAAGVLGETGVLGLEAAGTRTGVPSKVIVAIGRAPPVDRVVPKS